MSRELRMVAVAVMPAIAGMLFGSTLVALIAPREQKDAVAVPNHARIDFASEPVAVRPPQAIGFLQTGSYYVTHHGPDGGVNDGEFRMSTVDEPPGGWVFTCQNGVTPSHIFVGGETNGYAFSCEAAKP